MLLSRTHPLFFVCLVYYLLMSLYVPGFLSFNNSLNIIFNLLPLLIAVMGQTTVILTAGIDLSVTSIIAMTSVVGGYTMTSESILALGPGAAIFIGVSMMVLTGMLIGMINGASIHYFGMPPFMVTLTTMILFSGVAIWSTSSQNIYRLPETFIDLYYIHFLYIPVPVYMGALIVLLSHFILNKSLIGRWIYAIGHNKKASEISGVRINYTILFVYVYSGFCMAIASILYTSRLETGSPVMGKNILLDIIGAVVIGGTSLFGGKGKIGWSLLGVLFIVLLDNSLNLLGISFYVIMIIKGIVIITAALLNTKEFFVQKSSTNAT